MGHLTVIAGAAVAISSMGAALAEVFGTLNRREPADLTGRTRARIYVGGTVVGHSTAQLRAQYTLDLTGATGWDYLDGVDGPQVGILSLGADVPPQVSAWVPIVEAARTTVLVRVVSIGGDGVKSPAIANLGIEVSGPPLYDGNTLDGGTAGDVFGFFGGSQMFGAEHGQFGTPDAGVTAALDPLFVLGAGASGVTYIRAVAAEAGGSAPTLTAVGAEHGAEIGFIDQLRLSGKAAGKTILIRGVAGTDADAWVSTHFATLVADFTAAAVTPTCLCYVLGSNDANSDATVGALDNNLRALQALVDSTYPGCCFVVMGQVTTDLVTFPKLVEARLVGQRRFENAVNGRQAWVSEADIELQADDQHPTSAGTIVMGRRFAAPVLAAGIAG